MASPQYKPLGYVSLRMWGNFSNNPTYWKNQTWGSWGSQKASKIDWKITSPQTMEATGKPGHGVSISSGPPRPELRWTDGPMGAEGGGAQRSSRRRSAALRGRAALPEEWLVRSQECPKLAGMIWNEKSLRLIEFKISAIYKPSLKTC